MEQLFITVTKAVEGSVPVALTAAFVWGILSVILSPCHLSSIPLIIGFISEQENLNTRKAFVLSLLYGLGILVTIAVVGVITALMGRMIGDVGRYGNYAVAVIFFIVGLHLVGVIPLSFSGAGDIGMTKKGYWASFILGLVFGIGRAQPHRVELRARNRRAEHELDRAHRHARGLRVLALATEARAERLAHLEREAALDAVRDAA